MYSSRIPKVIAPGQITGAYLAIINRFTTDSTTDSTIYAYLKSNLYLGDNDAVEIKATANLILNDLKI